MFVLWSVNILPRSANLLEKDIDELLCLLHKSSGLWNCVLLLVLYSVNIYAVFVHRSCPISLLGSLLTHRVITAIY